MARWRTFCQTVHLVALGLWLGTLVMVGGASAVLFPTMKSLDPRLPAFAAYDGEHWRLAAGRIGQQLFLVADLVQFPCALLAAGTFLCLMLFLGTARQRGLTVVRAVALGVAVAAAAGEILVLAPSMNGSLKAYWGAAQAGDNGAAAVHQKAFTDLHPIAVNLLAIAVVAVFIALVAGARAASGTPAESRSGNTGA